MIRCFLLLLLVGAYAAWHTYEKTTINDSDFIVIQGVTHAFRYNDLKWCKVWDNETGAGLCCTLMKETNYDNSTVTSKEK